jgi:hypothetical protein
MCYLQQGLAVQVYTCWLGYPLTLQVSLAVISDRSFGIFTFGDGQKKPHV